jgi:hypothetical protein
MEIVRCSRAKVTRGKDTKLVGLPTPLQEKQKTA